MKKKLLLFSRKKIQIGKWTNLYCICLLFIGLVSCAEGFNDDEVFNSGVTDTQLESPDASKFVVSSVSIGGEEGFLITWPVVYGAGGYSFTLYNVDDPDNPVVVGVENQYIDGCSTNRPKQEDTKYKVVVKTLGNLKYNNSEAISPSEYSFTTLTPSVATIPDGADLAEYFTNNPIQSSTTEQAYDLVAGGSYTLNNSLDFELNWVTLRGDKVNHPTITYGSNGRLLTKSGLKLKFIDFDCNAMPATSGSAALLALNADPVATEFTTIGTGGYFQIEKDIVIQSCNIQGINKFLFWDNNKKYCVKTFRIDDCIIALNSAAQIIYAQGGGIKDLILSKNTFYGLVASSSFFIQYNSGARGTTDRMGYPGASICLYYNTFYNVVSNGQMGNYNGMAQASTELKLTQNLFVNCGNKEVVRRLSHSSNNPVRTLLYNCYWYDGGFTTSQEMGHANGDKSGTGFYATTTFTGPISNPDPELVNFTPTLSNFTIADGSPAIFAPDYAEKVGDPRWLPAQ